MTFDVFISYPHQDKAVADAACAKLEAEGIRCWIAPRDIAPSADWAASLVEAIDNCRVMVLVFSAHANRSKQVHREVQQAFDGEKPVVPFRIENVNPEKTLRYYMSSVHWLDALTPPLEQHLDRLVKSVKTLVSGKESDEDRPVGRPGSALETDRRPIGVQRPWGEEVRLQADVAQIQHDNAGFGSGRLVAKNLVLTAAHTLWNSAGSALPNGWQVRFARDRTKEGWRFRRESVVRWCDRARDLALIEITDFGVYPYFPKLALRVADILGNKMHHVEARGYPRASKSADRPRDLTPALGRLTAAAADRPLRFEIESSDLPNRPHLDWPGMSGSAVTLQDYPKGGVIWIYGVVQGVPANFDGQLSVSRLADAWKDPTFRQILVEAGAPNVDAEDPTTTDAFRFSQLVPENHSGYESVLAMIVSGTLNSLPVAALSNETLLAGHSLIELYRVVETLIERFQELCDEITEALVAGGIGHRSIYGSALRLGETRILKTNRKLVSIACDMRDIASSIREMLPEQSTAREKFGGILQICASISIAEDFLIVELGVPQEISISTEAPLAAMTRSPLGRIKGVELQDDWDQSLQIPEYARLQAQLDQYKRQLRSEIARVTGTSR